MFSAAGLLRIGITSILSSVAFNIGWYGVDRPWMVAALIVATIAAVAAAWVLIDRWQSSGYKRLSDRVPVQQRSHLDAPVRPAPAAKPSK